MEYFIVVLPALIVCFVMRYMYQKEISIKEFFIHFGAAIFAGALMLGLTYAALYSTMFDTEILNGKVIKKERHVEICTEMSDCKHYTLRERCSYSTNSKGESTKSCESYKDFDYSYEVDWYIKSTVGKSEIERVNNQGTKVPPRWAEVNIGDPASAEHNYLNYLLGSEDSLFYQDQYKKDYTEQYKKSLPEYPEIYDYYRVNHIINLTKLPTTGYNDYLNDVLRDMGAAQQVNLVMVMYPSTDSNFVKAVLGKWRGGKKNDVIMFFGLDENGVVKKFDSTSFGKGMGNELLHSKLRMTALTEQMSLDLVKATVYNVQSDFKRLPNKEFEYLKYKIQPSLGILVLCSILAMCISIGVGFYMRKINL